MLFEARVEVTVKPSYMAFTLIGFNADEKDYSLPKGVASRRDPLINASVYWVSDLTPKNVYEHIY